MLSVGLPGRGGFEASVDPIVARLADGILCGVIPEVGDRIVLGVRFNPAMNVATQLAFRMAVKRVTAVWEFLVGGPELSLPLFRRVTVVGIQGEK